MLAFETFEVITFDCYGTLIDWESGILKALRPIFESNKIRISEEHILELFASAESEIEARAYFPYREVLRKILRNLAAQFKFTLTTSEMDSLNRSLPDWEPFPDAVESLKKLKSKYKLAVISNIDDDLFAFSAKRLEVPFDWVFTAQQVKTYKPSLNNFRFALKTMETPPEKVLHAAQSLYHDIVPAKTLGLQTVWVNRRKGKPGFGATPPAKAEPDLEVSDLGELVLKMGL